MYRKNYYRVKKVYPKQKWLPVNNEVSIDFITSLEANGFQVTIQPITENPTRNASDGGGNVTSATIIKTGRFRFKGIITQATTGSTPPSYIIGVAYIPEGYIIDQTATSLSNLGTTFFYRHPEWILCWTRIDYPSAGQNNEFSLYSRLKRNLNSGDQIVVFRIAINTQGSGQAISGIRGTISYVCRSN